MTLVRQLSGPISWGLFLLVCVAGCVKQPPKPAEITGQTMGTWYHIKFLHPSSAPTLEEIKKQVDQRLGEINSKMSTYIPGSELSRFNRLDSTKPFSVSPETAMVVSAGIEIGQKSAGALDITVLPLVELWGFGAKERIDSPPSEAVIAAVRQRTGLGKLSVSVKPAQLVKSQPGLSVDLSAIAKGYGVDQVSVLLTALHLPNHLVEIGGELRASGHKTAGQPWVVGIEVPGEAVGQVQRSLPLNDLAMATSGDYRNYFEKDGVRYSHTIDPKTGRPIQHRLASVSVVAKDCMTADGWATALNVLGEVEGFKLAEEKGLNAYFIYREGKQFLVKGTQGFFALSKPKN